MRIGIDARLLSFWGGGQSRIVTNLIRELACLDQENDYYLYSSRDFPLPVQSDRWHKRIRARPRWRFWLQSAAKRMILKDRLDAFWGPMDFLPLGLPSSIGKLVMVYDLVWREYPETMVGLNRLAHLLFVRRSIREADRVLTISEFTRWGLINALGAPADKIRVTYPGVEPHYQPRDRIHSAHYIAEKFYVSNNYICAVGTVEPRKNLITLMQAIKILRDRGMLKHQLLIAGASGWKNSRIYAAVQRLGLTEREVKFLGHVPEEDLPVLYSGSCLFVFPSIYEGFGLPLLEAMASGVPVVASNVASMPEVVRDAAVLVSPLQPEEFADAIALVVSNEQLRQALIDKGIRRAQQFRWDTSARQILQLFKEVAHRPAESTANRASD